MALSCKISCWLTSLDTILVAGLEALVNVRIWTLGRASGLYVTAVSWPCLIYCLVFLCLTLSMYKFSVSIVLFISTFIAS